MVLGEEQEPSMVKTLIKSEANDRFCHPNLSENTAIKLVLQMLLN